MPLILFTALMLLRGVVGQSKCCCSAGSYYDTSGNCFTCPAGQISDVNIAYLSPVWTKSQTAFHGRCYPCNYIPGSLQFYDTPQYKTEEGVYCPTPGLATSLPCPAGAYCYTQYDGALFPEKVSGFCPTGKYSSRTGESTIESCTPCATGYYQPSTGATACNYCPSGFYCLPNGNFASICPAGSFCPGGEDSVSGPCPAGTYSGAYAPACTSCALGYYQQSTGQIACIPCAAGTFCPSVLSSGAACGAGQFAPLASDICTPCIAGYYQNNSSQASCLSCAAGYSCSSSAMTNFHDSPCPAGFYSSAGSSSCTICPVGFYQVGSPPILPLPAL